MSDLTIDGTTPDSLTVDGSSVDSVNVDGVKVWPDTRGVMVAGFDGGTLFVLETYGYRDDIGSISVRAAFNGGENITQLAWRGDFSDGAEGSRELWVNIDAVRSKGFFDRLIIDTDSGQKTFLSSNSTHTTGNNDTLWAWSTSRLFSEGNSYNYLFL